MSENETTPVAANDEGQEDVISGTVSERILPAPEFGRFRRAVRRAGDLARWAAV